MSKGKAPIHKKRTPMHKQTARKRMVVNRGNNAESTHAVVMKIPTEMYEEDQRAKQRDLDTAVAAFDPAGVKASGHSYDESKNIN